MQRKGEISFLDKLEGNDPALKRLYLGGGVGIERFSGSNMPRLAASLRGNTTLITLQLCEIVIGVEGVRLLAESLKENKTLVYLSINSCGIEDVQHIAEMLCENTVLKELHLSSNAIGEVGALHIATALSTNKTLTRLYHGSNAIGGSGARHIAAALRNAAAPLTTLDISDNWIGDSGALHFANMLQKKTQRLLVWTSAQTALQTLVLSDT